MGTKEIVVAASNPVFYSRVAFLALRTAQMVATEDPETPNHDSRLNYANRIFRGEEQPMLLAMHIAATNAAIASALESTGGDAVPDGDIEYVLALIWDARSNAYRTGVVAG